MLFNKTCHCSEVWFVWYGLFLFNTDDKYNAAQQTLVVKELVAYGFQIFQVADGF